MPLFWRFMNIFITIAIVMTTAQALFVWALELEAVIAAARGLEPADVFPLLRAAESAAAQLPYNEPPVLARPIGETRADLELFFFSVLASSSSSEPPSSLSLSSSPPSSEHPNNRDASLASELSGHLDRADAALRRPKGNSSSDADASAGGFALYGRAVVEMLRCDVAKCDYRSSPGGGNVARSLRAFQEAWASADGTAWRVERVRRWCGLLGSDACG